jgi:hypothetical protein
MHLLGKLDVYVRVARRALIFGVNVRTNRPPSERIGATAGKHDAGPRILWAALRANRTVVANVNSVRAFCGFGEYRGKQLLKSNRGRCGQVKAPECDLTTACFGEKLLGYAGQRTFTNKRGGLQILF